MEKSIVIAQILAVVSLAFAVGLATSRDYYQDNVSKLVASPTYVFLGGIITTVFGMLIVIFHNVWEANWTVLITIIGYITLIRGVLLLAAPRSVNIFDPVVQSGKMLVVYLPITLVLGIVLAYFGFFA